MKTINDGVVLIEHIRIYVYNGQAKLNLPKEAIKLKDNFYDIILIPR